MAKSVILIGAGGHAKVVFDCVRSCGDLVAGFLDDTVPAGTIFNEVPVLGPISDYSKYVDLEFLIAIGSNCVRHKIAQSLPVKWYTAIHSSAIISHYASIGSGTVVMPNAVVNSGTVIGSHCIINTGAIVEHDNYIEDFAHLSPSAILGGTVFVGEATHIGIGAVVRNNISICRGCTIGAGSAVVKDIEEPGTYAGVPARRLK